MDIINKIKNLFRKKEETPTVENNDTEIGEELIETQNPYIAFELTPDDMFIHISINGPKDIVPYAKMLQQISSGQLRSSIMDVMLRIMDEDTATAIIDEWGAFEVQHAAEKVVLGNSEPIVKPLDFFKGINK